MIHLQVDNKVNTLILLRLADGVPPLINCDGSLCLMSLQ
jgi:hypothetical protein